MGDSVFIPFGSDGYNVTYRSGEARIYGSRESYERWHADKDNITLVQFSPQKYTRWKDANGKYSCVKCGYENDQMIRYCPNCGKKAVNHEGMRKV
jgi:rubrerythrin